MPEEGIRQKYRRLVLGTPPRGDYILLRLRVTPLDMDLISSALHLLLILSQRTIRPLGYEDVDVRDIARLGAVVAQGSGPGGGGMVTLALPAHVCSQREGLTQLVLTATSGAEYGYTSELFVEDIDLPPAIMSWFGGPRLGVPGIRRVLNVPTRPLLGFIVTPRHSSSLEAVLRACCAALAGGVDLLVDDLLMTDPDGELGFGSRVPAICNLVKEYNACLPTGASRVGYLANVGSSYCSASNYAMIAKQSGALGALVDCFTMGFGNVKDLVDEHASEDFAFVATNMGSGVMGRNPDDEKAGAELSGRRYLRTGFAETLTAKLSRLAGVDAVHTGTVGSECFEVAEYALTHVTLGESLHRLERCFAVAEGDLQLANAAENIQFMGNDVIIETASGIANHPDGISAGARAFRALVGALHEDMSTDEMTDAINVIRSRIPEVDRGLAGWRLEHDERIRGGWTPDRSWRALQARNVANRELTVIADKTKTWDVRTNY